ncbi:MAG: DUF5003 domain-containing protein [Fermentimonas sp.]|jgi:hypothetical protein
MKKGKLALELLFITLLTTFGMISCDDDNNDLVPLTFPQKQQISLQSGETQTLTFDAASDWQLTSSAIWCRFVTDEGEEFSASGKAGRQEVKIIISDEGQVYDEEISVASLTMSMGEQRAIIAEVTRNGLGRELHIFKVVLDEETFEDTFVELAQGEALEVGYDDYNMYVVKGNFRFAAANRPDWLDVEGDALVGVPGQELSVGLQIVNNPSYYKYEQSGELTFQDEAGKAFFTYPIKYNGMPRESMRFQGPKPWNWIVSMDGQTFTQTSQSGLDGSTNSSVYNQFVEYTIEAYSDDYEALFVEKVEPYPGYVNYNTSATGQVGWMHFEKKGNGIARLTIDSSSKEREGYVFVFPRELYNTIAEDPYDPENGLFVNEMDPETGMPTKSFKYQYQQNNMLMNFVQKDAKQDGQDDKPAFVVKYYDSNWAQIEAKLTKVTDEGLISEYGTDLIYSMQQPETPMGFQVDPLMEGQYEVEWFFHAFKGNSFFVNNPDKETITCDNGKELTVWFSEDIDQNIRIVIKDQNTWVTKKVLIITPKN